MGLAHALPAPLPIQFLANGLRKAEGHDGPSIWAPTTHVRDLQEALGLWICPGSMPVIVASWGANQQRDLLHIRPSVPLTFK